MTSLSIIRSPDAVRGGTRRCSRPLSAFRHRCNLSKHAITRAIDHCNVGLHIHNGRIPGPVSLSSSEMLFCSSISHRLISGCVCKTPAITPRIGLVQRKTRPCRSISSSAMALAPKDPFKPAQRVANQNQDVWYVCHQTLTSFADKLQYAD